MQTSVKTDSLLAWYDAQKRDLPWRRNHDPYRIWVSEIMLQQTQVATVIPFFERWMKRFPTVETLAASDDQDVLSLWQGLGYYRRCRMLLSGARSVQTEGLPTNAAGWLNVPGIGRYTASAIASIAFGEPVAVVDGNVARVFARLTGCEFSGPALLKAAWAWADHLVPPDRPGDWNQALMELGATVCRPSAPLCQECPISGHCVAFCENRQGDLPVAAKRAPTISLEREAWVYERDGRFGLERIPEGEWWAGMWRFPARSEEEGHLVGIVKHVVTNHRIAMRVFRAADKLPESELSWFDIDELGPLPMPAPQRRALQLVVNRG